jgi:hypothetical protein
MSLRRDLHQKPLALIGRGSGEAVEIAIPIAKIEEYRRGFAPNGGYRGQHYGSQKARLRRSLDQNILEPAIRKYRRAYLSG